MNYRTILTTLGQAKIAAAIASGTPLEVAQIALGDGAGNATTPNATQTALVREVYRGVLNDFSQDTQNPNYLVAELIVPTTVGGWTVREAGLFDAAGDLVAVCNFPDTYKPQLSEGSARDLVVRMVIEVSNTEAVTFVVEPSAVIATRKWVSDNFSLAVVLPGGTTGMVLRKKSNQSGDVEWYDPASGMNIVVDAVDEVQTLAANQTVVDLAIARTTGACVYVAGLRLLPTEFTVNSETRLMLHQSYADGNKILITQNNPAQAINLLLASNSLGEIAALGAAAQAQARANLGISDTDANFTGGNVAFDRIVSKQAVLNYSTTLSLSFSGPTTQVVTLTGDVLFQTENRAANGELRIVVKSDATARTLSFPAGWHWQNKEGKPTNIVANKVGVLALLATGPLESDIVAGWSSEA